MVLTNDFAEDLGVLLLPREKMPESFSLGVEDGWEEFYRLYPRSQGYTWLSRVGFSRDGMQALVYIGTQSGSLSGLGRLVLLKWDGKSWQIQKDFRIWIS
jgi:hypothetical protein